MPILRVPVDMLALLMDLPDGVHITPEDEVDGVKMAEIQVEPNAQHKLLEGHTYALQYEEDDTGEPALVAFLDVEP